MTTTPETTTHESRWHLSKQELLIIRGGLAAGAAPALPAAFGGVPKAQPVVGAVVILGIAYAFSTNRRAIDLKTVVWGLSLQVVFALIVLKTEMGQKVFQTLGAGINRLLDFAGVGSSFAFGALGAKESWARVVTGGRGH